MAPTTILFHDAPHESSIPAALPMAGGVRSSARTAPTSVERWRAVRRPSGGVGPSWPKLLHEHFEVQADLRPRATAVVVGDASVSPGIGACRATRPRRRMVAGVSPVDGWGGERSASRSRRHGTRTVESPRSATRADTRDTVTG
jgi:hypothetical protein